MNSLLFNLGEKLMHLQNSNKLLAIKAEFEAEGTRIDELSILSFLCLSKKIPLTLKIGGPCAKRDIYEAFQLGANTILVPMVESAFAIEYCAMTYNSLISSFRDLDICTNLSINIESKNAIKNIDSILKKINDLSLPIKDIVIGRSDLAKSFNETDVNSQFILELSKMLVEKIIKNDIHVTIGGNLTNKSFNFIREFNQNELVAFESRKCTFSNSGKLSEKQFKNLINDGLEFELFWLDFKRNMYKIRSEEENQRITSIKNRIINSK